MRTTYSAVYGSFDPPKNESDLSFSLTLEKCLYVNINVVFHSQMRFSALLFVN